MRCFITSLALMVSIAASAQSQVPSSIGAEHRVTYFLIDASGSMRAGDNADEAEREVQKILGPLIAANPEAPVSRTYFRAQNRDLCSHPIAISDSVPASQSKSGFPASGNNDYTPLGTALESAIKRAGEGPASIFIVSDGVQSPDCGIDLCQVAETFLWADGPDITVKVVPIGAEAKAGPMFSCIEKAASRSRASWGVSEEQGAEVESVDAISDMPPSRTVWYWTKAFVRAWYWLIGVGLVAIAALAFGWRQSHAARILEEQTKQVRSYQDQIRSGDQDAEQKMQRLISAVERRNIAAEDSSTLQRHRHARARAWKYGSYILGGLGVFMLLGLAMLPSNLHGLSLEGTKYAAWKVFDSDFATAFAVLLTAIVFYAGAQLQRRQEARHNFGIVSEEATRAATRERDDAHRASHAAYEKQCNKFASLKFPIAHASEINKDGEAVVEKWLADAQFIVDRAKALALGERLEPSEPQAALEKETKRIEELLRKVRPFWWADTVSFIALVQELIASKIIVEDAEDWRAASAIIQSEGMENFRANISVFADRLKGATVN